MLERNNEVAVHWMLIKTMDALLLDHPTSLWQDRKKLHQMMVEGGAAEEKEQQQQQQQQQRQAEGVLQPDLQLSVQYTVWVKQSIHKAL